MATKHQLLCVLLVLLQANVWCYQYKVGDLDSWGLPTPANPKVYENWSLKHKFKIGDSLLFLYPPSQDSVIQVTEEAFNSCTIKDPTLYMNNGNSIFNLTTPGNLYFISGKPGHCEKLQKLHVSVLLANGSAFFPSSSAPTALPATSPAYPTVFSPSPPSSLGSRCFPCSVAAALAGAVSVILLCFI
ncbi:hypothetical protein QJS04_geneDACA019905 [Acorus gramineus]|uniref:Phytocyanin domain-containing protein n=1 Tax=Acorus gramineus TaxID=55184 RepID=A0AAV8ZX89_ACOGR|nr:hypothetical protein QJS04_geneDACA019901 [Acorus gramineus]KAK1257651.1 hypothetical protein QJS04_geneDACA019905 [Acorus gramineus]